MNRHARAYCHRSDRQRDLISFSEEWAFVERYLAIERLRFGDRLNLRAQVHEPARACLLPSFRSEARPDIVFRGMGVRGALPRDRKTALRRPSQFACAGS